ncbi:hypothetical protein ACPCTO_37635 [Streptomyces olivoreticuli]
MASYDPDLKLTGPLLLDGEIVTCPNRECLGVSCLTLTRSGFRETWPAVLGCETCGRSEDHPVITNGLVEAATEARTGRSRPEDLDTFAAEWRGLTLTGECRPEVILADLVFVGRTLVAEGKKEARGWWQGRKREAKAQAAQAVGTAKKAVARQASQATGAAKAAVLTAAWQTQTQGAGPAPKPKPWTTGRWSTAG